MKKNVSFQTEDGVTIVADYYKADLSIGHTILALHMMPTDRSSWKEFAEKANQAGYNVLAIDMRGHGESIQKGEEKLNFEQFSDEQHRGTIKDIDAGVEFLTKEGVENNNLSIIGASIGANLALNYLKLNHNIFTAVLMSPGLNYRGIELDKVASDLSSSQAIMLITGSKDEYPNDTVQKLQSIIPGRSEIIVLPSEEHGTNLFKDHPKLIIRILSWLNEEITL